MTDNEQAPAVEQWAYAGQRLTSKDTLVEAWVINAGDGDELCYAGRGKHILGSLYDIEVTRDGARTTRHGDPRYTGQYLPHDDERVRRWAVRDNAARVEHRQKRAEANDAKHDAIDKALEPLARLAGACRNRTERDALLATVIRRLAARW